MIKKPPEFVLLKSNDGRWRVGRFCAVYENFDDEEKARSRYQEHIHRAIERDKKIKTARDRKWETVEQYRK